MNRRELEREIGNLSLSLILGAVIGLAIFAIVSLL